MPRKPQRGVEEKEGVLAGHFRQGRIFRPSLLAYPEFTGSDWVRDDLPDLVWPAVVALQHGDAVVALFDELQKAVLGAQTEEDVKLGWALDGRLTSLEAVDSHTRSSIVDVAARLPDRARLFPSELVAIAGLYEGFPGAWLVSEPWTVDEAIAPDEAATILARAIVGAVQDTNALVKAPVIRWGLATGLMTVPEPLRDEILSYPRVDGDQRSATEAVIRSSFLGTKSLAARPGPDFSEARNAWATSFWSQNWHSTRVFRRRSRRSRRRTPATMLWAKKPGRAWST